MLLELEELERLHVARNMLVRPEVSYVLARSGRCSNEAGKVEISVAGVLRFDLLTMGVLLVLEFNRCSPSRI